MTQERIASLASGWSEPSSGLRPGAPSWLAPRPALEPRYAWLESKPITGGALAAASRAGVAVPTPLESTAEVRADAGLSALPRHASSSPSSIIDAALPRPGALPSLRAPELGARDEALQAAVAAVQELAAQVTTEIASARRAALEASERDLVRLAIAIAERIVDREIVRDPHALARWVASGIEALTRDDDVRVVASPRVAALLTGAPGAPRVDVDASFEGDRCEVRTKFGSVDVGLRARFDTLGAELLGEQDA